jgi:hypothetical protein
MHIVCISKRVVSVVGHSFTQTPLSRKEKMSSVDSVIDDVSVTSTYETVTIIEVKVDASGSLGK